MVQPRVIKLVDSVNETALKNKLYVEMKLNDDFVSVDSMNTSIC